MTRDTSRDLSAAAVLGEEMELNGKGSSPDEQLSAALEEMAQYKQELEHALEDSNAKLMSAEKELLEVREQCDDAKARLESFSERERGMEAQLSELQAQLDQANKDLERERRHWSEQYQAEKDMSEQLRGTLEAVQLQLESEAQKHAEEIESQRMAWVAKEKELWSLVEVARAESVSGEGNSRDAPAIQEEATDIPVTPEAAAAVAAAAAAKQAAAGEQEQVERQSGPQDGQEPVLMLRGEEDEVVTEKQAIEEEGKAVTGESPFKKGMDPSVFLNVDAWVSAATCGDGTMAPLAVNEEALRRNLASALSRLEGMQEIQEKWQKQVERMDEVESEWKGRLAGLEAERDELVHEVELLQEDLRREQELAMEAGLVAEEEWRKRQEIERTMAEVQRELAKQKKVAKEALMCIPRSTSDQSEETLAAIAAMQQELQQGNSVEGDDSPSVLGLVSGVALQPSALRLSESADTEEGPEEQHGAEGATSASMGALEPSAYGGDVPRASPSPSIRGKVKDEVLEDAGGLRDVVPYLNASEVLSLNEEAPHADGAGDGEAEPDAQAAQAEVQKQLNAQDSLLRLGQELGTLRKEVLELRMKLAEVRMQASALELDKKEAERRHKFALVCLQLVTNAKDKFEDQIAMATRHALEASAKARETDKQLFALLADIASLLKEHQVQAKNNGSTYNKYKIGKKEIEIVKEDLRQLIKFVQMKATLAEKGRQKNKTKAAADAARPRLAELRDGAAQEEEVLAELEKELDEARKRTEEAEKMHSMVAAMREKERQTRESVERDLRAVQAKMQEAEIMKQQVEALKQTEQVLSKELTEETKELKVKSLEAEEVEGRISALEATESVIREELEMKTRRVREIDRQFPRLMGLGLGSELPPPGLLGRKMQEEVAWKEKRKVLEDLKVMKEQLIWTQSSLLKSRQRLPELIQEAKECKRRVDEKEKETKRVQQWLKDHDLGRGGAHADDNMIRKSISSSWSWWKKKDEVEPSPSRLGAMSLPRIHAVGSLLPRVGSDEPHEPHGAPLGIGSPAPSRSPVPPGGRSGASPQASPKTRASPPVRPVAAMVSDGHAATLPPASLDAQRAELQQRNQEQALLQQGQPHQQLVASPAQQQLQQQQPPSTHQEYHQPSQQPQSPQPPPRSPPPPPQQIEVLEEHAEQTRMEDGFIRARDGDQNEGAVLIPASQVQSPA